MPMLPSSSPSWFETWFDHPYYLDVYRHRDSREALQCVATISAFCRFPPLTSTRKRSVLDIACGNGRHAIEFAKNGFAVTGNDLSPSLLREAQNDATAQQLEIAFTNHDMRTIPLTRQYDLVVQLFTSFGYFDHDADDHRVLANACSLVAEDGWYVLDLINARHLQKHLQPFSTRQCGTLTVSEQRTLSQRHVKKTIAISAPDAETITFTEQVRLYETEEINAMLHDAGFRIVQTAGNYDGSRFDAATSPRMMIFCQKGR